MTPNRAKGGIFAGVLLAWLCTYAGAAAAGAPPSLFDSDELLDLQLSGPVSTLIDDRSEREERAILLTLDGVQHEALARVRGKSRSREKVCDFPPLRLRFADPAAVAPDEDKLKLVTHCRNDDRGDADVMEEYAAYRVFSLLSPAAFRVRPARITYQDSDGRLDEDARQRYGFLLEPAQRLAQRIGGEVLELPGVALSRLDADQAALVYVFQYMIGNTDWSLVTGDGAEHCCHNGLLLGLDGAIHYVPYDFDLSGIVSARYAKPDPSLRLRSVRSRRYLGFCTRPETLAAAIRRLVAHEEEIYDVVRTTPGLGDRARKKDIEYLEGFFERARDPDDLRERFEKHCKSP